MRQHHATRSPSARARGWDERRRDSVSLGRGDYRSSRRSPGAELRPALAVSARSLSVAQSPRPHPSLAGRNDEAVPLSCEAIAIQESITASRTPKRARGARTTLDSTVGATDARSERAKAVLDTALRALGEEAGDPVPAR